uniref:lipid kinase YegS n=1 Tax=Halomonas sp. TaxID=1486246 RepID=UPI002638FEAC|nr:lipid kinase YegS [Halomonas sp.]
MAQPPGINRLILNGQRAQQPEVRNAVFACRRGGLQIEVRVTWEQGDAQRQAYMAGCEGVKRVIAGGGDGSVNEVVNGLMQLPRDKRPELAIMPLGSANDLARSLGLPPGQAASLDAACRLPSRWVDVPLMNDRYFINMATGGFGAAVTSSTPKRLKRLMGGGAYSVVGAFKAWRYELYQGHVAWEGDECRAGIFLLALGNGVQAGGGQKLTPAARLDDGLLDVMLVRDFASLRQLYGMMKELRARPYHGQYVDAFRTRWLRFEADGDHYLPLTLDGEPCFQNTFEVSISPLALRLVMPDSCRLAAPAGE